MHFFCVFAGLTVVFASYTTWRLRKVQENFFIKHELLEAVVFATFTLVVSNSLPDQYFHVKNGVYLLACHLHLFSLLTEPVIRAYYADKRRLTSHRRDKLKQSSDALSKDLSSVLRNPEELEPFTDFLKREFAIENLLFYKDCRRFLRACERTDGKSVTSGKDSWAVEKRNFRAAQIFEEYLTPRSVLEVRAKMCMARRVFTDKFLCYCRISTLKVRTGKYVFRWCWRKADERNESII